MDVKVFWITGLSGAGKTTFALKLASKLRSMGRLVVLLDGDELREIFKRNGESHARYKRADRVCLAFQYAKLCKMLSKQGVTVVIATISLFAEVHKWNRANILGYFEVYLRVPIEELKRRDPKGIYRSYFAGELSNVAGLDLDIDEPESADLVLDFEKGREVHDLLNELLTKL